MPKPQARIKQTGEIFTPHELCLQMVRDIPKDKLKDSSTTYLDPSCGDGNFLVALHQVLTEDYGHDSVEVQRRLYGIDIMADNIEEARRRLPHANLVCADALTFDYDSW